MIQSEREYLLEGRFTDPTGMFSDLCEKDVTDEYLECSDVTVTMSKEHKNNRSVYLCVFGGGRWIPVCVAPVIKGKAVFSKMGRMIVYLPAVYENGKIKPINQPFYFTEEGRMVNIEPSSEYTSKMKLVSKYPMFSYAAIHAYKMKGGRFEGAHSRDFKDAETLFRIDYYPFYYQEIEIESKHEYRYYRYVAPEHVSYGFSELHFYTNTDTIPILGVFFDQFNTSEEHFEKMNDDDLNTSVTDYPVRNSWLGFDAKERLPVVKIRFAPVNDSNCIIKGQRYELFYWNKGEWSSLGKQTALSDFLEFENVPLNALFWLRCYSGGREERIFTYKDGRQVWW